MKTRPCFICGTHERIMIKMRLSYIYIYNDAHFSKYLSLSCSKWLKTNIRRPVFYLNTTFRKPDSVTVFKWNLLIWIQSGVSRFGLTQYVLLEDGDVIQSPKHRFQNCESHIDIPLSQKFR
jgi:hypothetical protein